MILYFILLQKFGMLEGKCSRDYIEAARAANIKPVHHYTPPGGETLLQVSNKIHVEM